MRISDWSSDVCSSDLIEQAPRRNRRAELGVLNSHEEHQLARTRQLERFDPKDRRSLRHRLDLEDAGHDRGAGAMPLEELLVHCHGLNRVDAVAKLKRLDPIENHKWIAGGQGLWTPLNVYLRSWAVLAQHGTSV